MTTGCLSRGRAAKAEETGSAKALGQERGARRQTRGSEERGVPARSGRWPRAIQAKEKACDSIRSRRKEGHEDLKSLKPSKPIVPCVQLVTYRLSSCNEFCWTYDILFCR